jgi:hypothetical protein
MSLTSCRECQGQVSEEARSCPHCGAPRPADHNWAGSGYEWKSSRTYAGYPLVHISFGRDRRGKWRVAKGIIAIGQFGVGLVTIAQFGVGLIFGFGQVIVGPLVLAQVAVGLLLGVGQVATGYAAVGQVVLAYYGLGQTGWAHFLWSSSKRDPAAVDFFLAWWDYLKNLLQW